MLKRAECADDVEELLASSILYVLSPASVDRPARDDRARECRRQTPERPHGPVRRLAPVYERQQQLCIERLFKEREMLQGHGPVGPTHPGRQEQGQVVPGQCGHEVIERNSEAFATLMGADEMWGWRDENGPPDLAAYNRQIAKRRW